ncbi:DNA primase [Bacillus aerolatus]|uniref:DNA primase n=1 Tax=Bacillus aerolatus TaxID=2653354 RepID=A0A6I1FR31_9BACI|nr:DNA primase [Bacillus aerolatus]KAB7709214.1 DNA primase [Bacillus aerolatus]
MAGKIPEETIQQIKQSLDITEVIGDYVQLKKQGRNFFGLCPFHGENSPSFSVSPDKQIYHCFGCGAGGNVFSFLTEIENISFQEAVGKLAERAGIAADVSIPAESRSQPVSKEHDQMMKAHELLAKFYHHLLLNTAEGQEALDYLEKRGFSKNDLETFQIGWSLPNWDFTAKFLQKRGFTLEWMEKAGLIIRKEEDGNYFDRFRGRIMFPLHDEKGKVVAFSGRALHEEKPKYLNSPETPVFNKSRLLYNFHRARPAIRKQHGAVLFEGFADVIAAAGAGVEAGIATMGTSLTDAHIQQIKRTADQVIICYDGDSAGIQAAFRASGLLEGSGCDVKVALIPDKMDPDDYIKKHGAEKFRNNIIGTAMTLMAFKMEYYKQGKNLQDEAQKLHYIEEVVAEVAKLKKAVERDYYLRQIADQFSLSLDALKQQEKQLFFKERKKQPPNERTFQPASAPQMQKRLYPAFQTAERRLIAHMLKDADTAYKVKELLSGETFNLDEHQAIFTYLLGFYEGGNMPDSSAFISFLPNANLCRLVSDIEMMMVSEVVNDEEVHDYIKEIFKYRKILEIKAKKQRQVTAEKAKDYQTAAQIAMEIVKLKKELR